MKNKLAIITVFYNNYQVGEDFFKSLGNQKNQNFHVYVADLSIKKKKNLGGVYNSFPKIAKKITIISSQNKGYAYGVNLGLKEAIKNGFFNFCVINNDVFFNNDFVDQVLLALKNNPYSISGGKIYYAKGFEYYKDRYQKKDLGSVIWYAGGFFDWRNVLTPHRGVDEIDRGWYNNLEEVDFVTGCLMIFDKKVVKKIGFWDESYFLYFEDADYCQKAIKKNIKIYYNPKIVIYHKNAQSTQGAGSLIHQKYQKKSRLKFGLKYAPLRTKIHLLMGK